MSITPKNKINCNEQGISPEERDYGLKSSVDTALSTGETNSAQLDSIAYNISQFPRIGAEVTDKPRIERAILELPLGANLMFDLEEYDITGDITLNRRINLIGKISPTYSAGIFENGTIFKGGQLFINTEDVIIENIGIDTEGSTDGFNGTTTLCKNIKLTNCKAIAVNHCFIFESYYGEVENIIVENCRSYDSIHGFISKAPNVTFKNCIAYNHPTGYGYGCISDNMPSASEKGQSQNNKINDCSSMGCNIGLAIYSRDYFSEDNTYQLDMYGLCISNFSAIDSLDRGYSLGDASDAPTGKTYNQCKNINISSSTEINSASLGVVIGKIKDSYINVNSQTTPFYYDAYSTNNEIFLTDAVTKKPKQSDLTLQASYNLALNHNWEVSGTGVTSNVITTTNQPLKGNEIIFIIRNTSGAGTFTYGGFDASKFSIPTSLPTVIPASGILVTKWIYGAVNKWYCVSYVLQ